MTEIAPALSIPSGQRPAIVALAQMAPEVFEALAEQLGAAGASSAAAGLLQQLRAPSTEVSRSWSLAVVTLIGLRILRDQQGVPEDAIAASLTAEASRLRIVEPIRLPLLQERLSRLLVLRSVVLTSKAFDLATEYEHPLRDARILTDVRTIFEPSETRSAAAVIMHVMKLRDMSGNEYFSALTTSELKKLQATIDRALQKEQEIRERLAKAELHCLVEEYQAESGESE